MKIHSLVIATIVLAACGRAEPTEIELQVGKAARVNGCNVFLHHALAQDPVIADLAYACDVPESFVTEKNWWGEGTQPPASSIYVGECQRFGMKFYCVESIEPGVSVKMRATYEVTHRRIDHLRPIR
ncbi:MAG TPA: hypothetical protein VM694_27410 [Polyangium sp.]|nr:hypothetical protein [Polyangium sp.]